MLKLQKRILIHELGHAIGLIHEQSRPDRDRYVHILFDNIVPGKEKNFDRFTDADVDTMGISYDYRSVMHYGSSVSCYHFFVVYVVNSNSTPCNKQVILTVVKVTT